jgi:hypothetical protein
MKLDAVGLTVNMGGFCWPRHRSAPWYGKLWEGRMEGCFVLCKSITTNRALLAPCIRRLLITTGSHCVSCGTIILRGDDCRVHVGRCRYTGSRGHGQLQSMLVKLHRRCPGDEHFDGNRPSQTALGVERVICDCSGNERSTERSETRRRGRLRVSVEGMRSVTVAARASQKS